VSRRTTNPLNPSYQIRDESGQLVEIGDVVGSSPNGMPPARKDDRLIASLRTDDIIGAKAGTKGVRGLDNGMQRSPERQVNRTDDIEGAQSGSLRKCPRTNRVSNPLDPSYDVPGHKELPE
jgi:hypothetical protein